MNTKSTTFIEDMIYLLKFCSMFHKLDDIASFPNMIKLYNSDKVYKLRLSNFNSSYIDTIEMYNEDDKIIFSVRGARLMLEEPDLSKCNTRNESSIFCFNEGIFTNTTEVMTGDTQCYNFKEGHYDKLDFNIRNLSYEEYFMYSTLHPLPSWELVSTTFQVLNDIDYSISSTEWYKNFYQYAFITDEVFGKEFTYDKNEFTIDKIRCVFNFSFVESTFKNLKSK